MSYQDIAYDLKAGVFAALGTIEVDDVSYPVYKSIPKDPADVFIWIGLINQTEDGTKDNFIYTGTINIHVFDNSQTRADTKLAYSILGVVRGYLKPDRETVPDCGDKTVVSFTPGAFNELISQSDEGIFSIQLIDTYNFIIN